MQRKDRKVSGKKVPVTPDVVETDSLLNVAHILPEQFFSESRFIPEQKLMLAVLEEALRCYVRTPASVSRRRLAQEAQEWFESADKKWPFSFLCICEALNLKPDYVRARLPFIRESRKGKKCYSWGVGIFLNC